MIRKTKGLAKKSLYYLMREDSYAVFNEYENHPHYFISAIVHSGRTQLSIKFQFHNIFQ